MKSGHKIIGLKQGWQRVILFLLIGIIFPSFTGAITELIILKILKLDRYGSELFFVFGQSWGLIFILYIFLKEIENEKIQYIGFTKVNIQKIFQSFLYPIMIFSIPFLVLILLGFVIIQKFEFSIIKLMSLAFLFIFVAIYEELLFRGYLLKTLCKSFSKVKSIFLISILFSLIHLFNSNLSIIGTTNIFLFSVFVSMVFLESENIFYPIFIHWFWNFLQAAFGYHVSGSKSVSLFTIDSFGNRMINGGDFGIEGSILVTLAILMACCIYLSKSNLYERKTKEN